MNTKKNRGLVIALSVIDGKSQLKLRNNGCSVTDLNSAIVYLELAKLDLLKQLRKTTKKGGISYDSKEEED